MYQHNNSIIWNNSRYNAILTWHSTDPWATRPSDIVKLNLSVIEVFNKEQKVRFSSWKLLSTPPLKEPALRMSHTIAVTVSMATKLNKLGRRDFFFTVFIWFNSAWKEMFMDKAISLFRIHISWMPHSCENDPKAYLSWNKVLVFWNPLIPPLNILEISYFYTYMK